MTLTQNSSSRLLDYTWTWLNYTTPRHWSRVANTHLSLRAIAAPGVVYLAIMDVPSFTTSKSMLMHAALAYISPEVTTLNQIIQCGHNPAPAPISFTNSNPSTQRGRQTPDLPRLPTEILLLIREWLVPEVIAARQTQTRNALTAYEHTLRKLLCEDCVLYNLDIYGPNMWDWEQFTSACSCREPGVPKGYRSSSAPSERRVRRTKLRDGHDSISVSPTEASTEVNPKQFLDAEHWLEGHLSREAALCVGYRGHEASSPADDSTDAISDSATEATVAACTAPAFDVDIWKVVASVLREFDCEAVREAEDAMSAHQRAARRQQFRLPSHSYVKIMPLGAQKDLLCVDSEQLDPVRQWDMQRRLHLTYKELGMWSDYPDTFFDYFLQLSAPLPRNTLEGCFGFGRYESHSRGRKLISFTNLTRILRIFLHVSFSITAVLVSVPLTLTTFAVTLLCYYSRPKSSRFL